MATSEEVARLAGVSRATVSRVLNGSPRISEEARRRVYEAIEALGYEPDIVAQSLVRQRSRTLALGLFDESNGLSLTQLGLTAHYFYIDMLRYIEQEAMAQGYDLLLPSRPKGTYPENYIRSLRTRRVAGAVMLAVGVEDPRVHALLQAGIPTVFLDTMGLGSSAVYVRSDHLDGARQVTEHLLSLGHRRIAFLPGPAGNMVAMERLLGGQQAMARAGIAVDPGLIFSSGWNVEEAYQAVCHLLEQRRDWTALVAGSDLMALGALRALHERGLRVPDDVSLTGFDDVVLSQYMTPPLTTVRQDRARMGKEAVQRLVALIEGKEHVAPLIVPTQLVVRASTAPVRPQV
uniref:LacI family transcriptional regulator n=1 Tax=Thermosporothrix sp. COM3 TaxID=2490863 RepID=A0A455SIA7_9CHLR|nr:LacI family transcriptional regulator [Thermosporothrix sp. COM3]